MDSYNLLKNPVTQSSAQPDVSRLILEKEYKQWKNEETVRDVYSEYLSLLDSCSMIQKQKISTHPDFIEADRHCENALKQCLYAQAMPLVLNTPKGRELFERLVFVTKKIKDEIVKKELEKEKELEKREKELDEKSKQIDALLNSPEIQKILSSQNNKDNNSKNYDKKNHGAEKQ